MSLLRNIYDYLKTKFWYKIKFYSIGKKTIIQKPLKLDATKSILVGSNTIVARGAWLMGSRTEKTPTLLIGDNVRIGHHSHIIGLYNVEIGESVLIADKVYISDCTHLYQDVNCPIYKQDVSFAGDVKIGDESWIGENVVIIGAKIGKHSVIGANSVVNRDIPDYCVAVGSPAKIVKKYDVNSNMWISIEGSI